ncbi:MAG: hypothetical protein LBW77_04070 [Verrucomicrobiota bacterium]|jgi:hypothetical protein|nr:hypothetical protein [Verrucomicrobiota bacterium]
MRNTVFSALVLLAAAFARAEEGDARAVVGAVQAEVRAAHGYWRDFQDTSHDRALLPKIERCYQRVLAFTPVLQQLPVEEYEGLLSKGTVPDAYRPTLYDVVVHELLDFYAAAARLFPEGDEGAALPADGPALKDAEGFCEVAVPDGAAQRSRVLRALRLYQVLLAFHERDEDRSAYADADLGRLLFCGLFAAGAGRDERYAAALDRFAHTWRRLDVSTRAIALRARLALGGGDLAFARMLARNGAATFPASVGAAQCRNLIAEVETPELAVAVPKVWRAPWPSFTVTYRNLTQVTFRAVADRGGAGGKPAKVWTVPLPPAPDCRVRDYEVTVPRDLPPGGYTVSASTDGKFESGGLPVFSTVIRVGGGDEDGPGAPVAFAQASGEWECAREPDAWRYRAWLDENGDPAGFRY